jgi:hypothetical protein
MKSTRKKTAKKTDDTLTPELLRDTRNEIKELLVFAIEYLSVPMTLDEVLQFIFEEEKGETDRMHLLKTFIKHVNEPELISSVYRLLNHAWLFFPHHFLNGKAPIEMTEKAN